MRRPPLLPTLLVALACAAMVSLGMWQLRRKAEKEALLAHLARNRDRPAIALPRAPDDTLLFRVAGGTCRRPTAGATLAGRAADGSVGWRRIVACPALAGQPAFLVQIGIAADPTGAPGWNGGPVRGYLTQAPQARSVLSGLWNHAPRPMMLVADVPAPGLKPNSPPSLADVPNNHLAYAVQWFVFAAIAATIYLLALRKRTRVAPVPPAR